MPESMRSHSSRSTASLDSEERLLPPKKDDFDSEYRLAGNIRVPNRRLWSYLPCIGLAVIILLCTNIALATVVIIQSRSSKFGTFESGFSTDMGKKKTPSKRPLDGAHSSRIGTMLIWSFTVEIEPARPAIEAIRKSFTGELKRHPNGSLYRDMPGPQYFGEPSEEIDQNWSRLLYASGLELERDEIELAGLKATTWEEPQGGLWRTGLDVFHQLHCVNMVRKSFYPEYYEIKHDNAIDDPPRLRNMHRDHCLDYVRQAIMCNADATPVRLQWDYQAHFLIPKFDQLHTCRNFDLLHAWSRARALEKTHDESTRLINEMRKNGTL